MSSLDPSVLSFAERMEARLVKKDEKWSGRSWKDSPVDFDQTWWQLQHKLELFQRVSLAYSKGARIDREGLKTIAADIANYMMILTDSM
jgi:hypothetical protein